MEERAFTKGMKDGESGLRLGYTTGSCAAAAATGAARMLFEQSAVDYVTISLPSPIVQELTLEIEGAEITAEYASCFVRKYSGDDPDITDGIKVHAKAERTAEGITITGGKGIGTVTRRGLQVKPGSAAINPVPLKMIKSSVAAVLPPGMGVHITISAPDGENIATKTFNPKLGIEGGISILGTTGIVRPMSVDALKRSIDLELSTVSATGSRRALLVPGNHGQKMAEELLGSTSLPLVTMSNYPGFTLDRAKVRGFEKLLVIGHIGKLVKIAGGIFDTHSRVADARLEILAAHFAFFTESTAILRRIMSATTTDEAINLLKDEKEYESFLDHITQRIEDAINTRLNNDVRIRALSYSFSQGFLGPQTKVKSIVQWWKNNEQE